MHLYIYFYLKYKEFHQNGNVSPRKYNEMRWKLDTNIKTRCDADHQTAPYIFCVRSYIAKTEIPVFEDKGNDNLEFKEFEVEDNERQDNGKPIGYQLPCKGDSGSGHWITENSKAILVGITITGSMLCGRTSHMQATFDKIALDFIKSKAGCLDSGPTAGPSGCA